MSRKKKNRQKKGSNESIESIGNVQTGNMSDIQSSTSQEMVEQPEEPIQDELNAEEFISIGEGMWDITKISIPMMISFSMSFILITSAIYSGHLDDDEDHEAATTLITALANSISAITFGPLFSVGIIISQLYGEYLSEESEPIQNAEDTEALVRQPNQALKDKMVHYNKNAILLAGTLFTIPTLILAFSGDLLEKVGRQNENVSEIAQQYLRIFSIGMFGWGWRVVNEQVMFACLKQKPTAAIGVVNFSIATALSYLFGFGLGQSIPKMGLQGVALGYVVEAYLTPLMLTFYILSKHDLRQIGFFRKWGFNRERDFAQLAHIGKIALPMFISFANEFGVQLAMNNLMGVLGTKQLAAQNVMSQFYFFAYFPLISFAQATSQEFSRSFGAKKYKNARTYAISGCSSVGLLVLTLSTAVSIYPQGMAYLLVNNSGQDQDWFQLLKGMAPIGALGMVFDALGFNMLQVLRVGGDNAVSSTISAASLWSGIGIGSLLGFKTNLGAYGITAGYTTGLMIRAGLLGLRWKEMIKPGNLKAIKEGTEYSIFQGSFSQSLFFRRPNLYALNRVANNNQEEESNERQATVSLSA